MIHNNFNKGDKIGYVKLSQIVMREIGSDPRTISNTLKLMLETKLIRDIGNSHFKVLIKKDGMQST